MADTENDARRNLDSTSKKYHEVSEKLVQKNRQYQKLQATYESFRRRSITTSLFEKGDKKNQRDIPKNFTMPISSGDGFQQKGQGSRTTSPLQRSFILCPSSTPEQIIQKFTLPLGTPNN